MIFTAILLFLQPQGGVVVTTRHAIDPHENRALLEARCGNQRLQIANFGYTRPQSQRPSIRVNGRLLTGAFADALSRDLSRPHATYRLNAGCFRHDGSFELDIEVGQRNYEASRTTVHVDYFSARALIRNGRIERYQELAASHADDFWH